MQLLRPLETRAGNDSSRRAPASFVPNPHQKRDSGRHFSPGFGVVQTRLSGTDQSGHLGTGRRARLGGLAALADEMLGKEPSVVIVLVELLGGEHG